MQVYSISRVLQGGFTWLVGLDSLVLSLFSATLFSSFAVLPCLLGRIVHVLQEKAMQMNVKLKSANDEKEIGKLLNEQGLELESLLEAISDTFTDGLFWWTGFSLSLNVVNIYVGFTYYGICQRIPLFAALPSYLCLVVVFCYVSTAFTMACYIHLITRTIHGLQADLEDLVATLTGSQTKDNQTKKEFLIHRFTSFKGFRAKHHFVVNGEFFCSVVNNFATILIILIQFKLSEVPSNQV